MMGDRKKAVTAILGPDSPNVGVKGEEEGDPEALLDGIGEELIECFQAKDAKGVVAGIRALFEEFDSQPHSEGPHLG